ncbi:cytochrome P450 [Streptomyces sp. NPDC053048]|uniref:cytochrome P450 n=1 Tax=Streptomyces sp. NPDC053048 TaxID=3365694 RepID=UPI0037D6E435
MSEEVCDFPAQDFAGGPLPLPRAPVFRTRLPTGEVVWAVTGYDEVRTALAHPLLARDITAYDPESEAQGAPLAGGALRDRTLLLDGPPHAQLRRLAVRPLTPRRVAALRPRIEEITGRVVDAFVAAGPPGDLVRGVAFPVPIAVICEILGIPESDSAVFGRWADRLTTFGAMSQDDSMDALFALLSYLSEHLAAKRERPGPDLLSEWLAPGEGEDRFTDAELTQLALAVLVAGYETTATAIAASVWQLTRRPDQWRTLSATPELVPDAVQELFRFQPRAPMFRILVARRDLELGGVTIRRGDGVMPLIWAAHRDPACCAEPDRFDIRRTDNTHIVFGHGPHTCLGMALATVELEVVLGALLCRLPGLRPAAPPDTLPWHTDRLTGGGLVTLPVLW